LTAAYWLGRVGYDEAVELQQKLRDAVLAGHPGAVLLVEHPSVVTLGRRGGEIDAAALAARGIDVRRTDRGGEATWHGPGQLVAYPVLSVRSVVAHVEALAAAAVAAAASVGVTARCRREPLGVFTYEGRKLAAIGVHLHRRVATHGLALNVDAALDAFELIVPCGRRDIRPTSLAEELGAPVGVQRCLAPFCAGLASAWSTPVELLDAADTKPSQRWPLLSGGASVE
jgi:lipoate-protein ligase B